jgi:hypothetical protein
LNIRDREIIKSYNHSADGVLACPSPFYGIKNCDTMKKARAWLEKRGVSYPLCDYKASGIARERLSFFV